jgi:hypothetical protein
VNIRAITNAGSMEAYLKKGLNPLPTPAEASGHGTTAIGVGF